MPTESTTPQKTTRPQAVKTGNETHPAAYPMAVVAINMPFYDLCVFL